MEKSIGKFVSKISENFFVHYCTYRRVFLSVNEIYNTDRKFISKMNESFPAHFSSLSVSQFRYMSPFLTVLAHLREEESSCPTSPSFTPPFSSLPLHYSYKSRLPPFPFSKVIAPLNQVTLVTIVHYQHRALPPLALQPSRTTTTTHNHYRTLSPSRTATTVHCPTVLNHHRTLCSKFDQYQSLSLYLMYSNFYIGKKK